MLPAQPRKKFVPHKTLHEGWTYVSTEDGTVIGVRVSVTKVMRFEDNQGNPIKDPSGNPVYEFQSTNVAKVLSKEEWEVVKKAELTRE
jgi:hypothetical protein